MAVGRPRQYPILSCPCCQADMVRHHDIYYDCGGCQMTFKEAGDGGLIQAEKRKKKAETVKAETVKYLSRREFEELVG
jgi:hypothetical protein